MSSRRSQNLNISGFSPIQLNVRSPAPIKSPGKDSGINERIEVCKEKVFASYDRWKLADGNGSQIIQIIHNLKEKARSSNESPYPKELEIYSKKLEVVQTVLGDVIKSTAAFRKEMNGSINILESMNDNEELKLRLTTIQKYLDNLTQLYESSLHIKKFIIENIAHTTNSQDSQCLLASWSCDPSNNKIFQLLTQLKISPPDHQWTTS